MSVASIHTFHHAVSSSTYLSWLTSKIIIIKCFAAPTPVTGLHVDLHSNKNSVDFQVVWEKPELQPNNYTVIVQPLDLENSSVQVTVSGVCQCWSIRDNYYWWDNALLLLYFNWEKNICNISRTKPRLTFRKLYQAINTKLAFSPNPREGQVWNGDWSLRITVD